MGDEQILLEPFAHRVDERCRVWTVTYDIVSDRKYGNGVVRLLSLEILLEPLHIVCACLWHDHSDSCGAPAKYLHSMKNLGLYFVLIYPVYQK